LGLWHGHIPGPDAMQDCEEKASGQVSFLTDDEKDFIAKLRDTFKDELNRRRAEGLLHDCFFGDIAFCRIYHCCGGKLDYGKLWLLRWLDLAKEFKVDELYAEVYEKWKEDRRSKDSASLASETSILPYYGEVHQFMDHRFSAPKLSPDGDIISYLPMIDQDKLGVLAGLDWDEFVKFNRGQLVLRYLELNRLSHLQGRMVQVILVVDLSGSTMDSMFVSAYDSLQGRDINKFAEAMGCEIIRKVYVTNAPWAIATLYSLAKAVMPEGLSRKMVITSGDGLRDTEFVEMVGGEEQLKALYASRRGLVTKSRHVAKSYTELLDSFPTEQEQELIDLLRQRFKDEFEKRKQEGRDYPAFFGNLALLRVVRGNNGCLGPAVQWFKRFLQRMEDGRLDTLIQELTRKLDESGGQFGSASMLPYYDEIKDHSKMMFSAPRLSPAGDVISYLCMGDHHRAAIIANVPWEHWVGYAVGMALLRSIECERLSRIQNRLVRFIQIVDLEGSGVGVSGLPKVPEFDVRQSLEIEPILYEVCVDQMRFTYVVNAPWLSVKAYNFWKMLVPERISRKVHLLNGDGRGDRDFVKLVGGEAQLHQLLSSRIGIVSGIVNTPSGTQEIRAGDEFQKIQEMRAGQRVNWKFSVDGGSGDGWFGASDLTFSITAFWMPQQSVIKEDKPGKEGCQREKQADQEGREQSEPESKDEGSLDFDGVGGFVQMTEVPSFETFTWSLWVKPEQSCWCNERVFLRRADQICLNAIDGSLRLWLHDGHWHCVLKAPWDQAFAGTWHHLAASFDGGVARLFVNGMLVSAVASSVKLSQTTNRILIGAGLDYADRYFFQGQLTEVRLHSVACSAKQIGASMRARVDSRSEPYLVGYAQLCGGVGFAERKGVLLQENVGKVAARSYSGGGTFASTASPFALTIEAAVPEGDSTQDKPEEAVTAHINSSPLPIEVIQPPETVSSGRQMTGFFDATRNGLLTFKWSNEGSRLRSKSLQYSLEVDCVPECEVGECSAAVPPAAAPEERPHALEPRSLAAPVREHGQAHCEKASPEAQAALAVVELALSFQEESGPNAIYMLDE